MKKSNYKKEFIKSNYICPFKNKICNTDNCTHFKPESKKYYWDNEIKIYDNGTCYAGGTNVELWESIFTLHPTYKEFDFWKEYRKFRKLKYNPISALIAAYMLPKEKNPYDFEEIFKQIQDGTFNPLILSLR